METSLEKEAAGIKAGDDYPPGILSNVCFWFWQIICWIGYAIISLVYVPWALAMHVILAALAIPFAPVLCSRFGRKVFIYTYVVTVMMPGKYIWFNALLRTKRRGRIWDYEMGKPRAIPPNRRPLSHHQQMTAAKAQEGSRFLSRLPPEIRMQIYRELFVGDSSHLHVLTRRAKVSRTSPPEIKVRGYLCNRSHTEERFASCGCMIGAHAHHDPPISSETELPTLIGNGRIAILQSCRKIYAEAIELMYSAPTFCFNNLEQPPFFILSTLPHRLSHIQHIQLCWKQITMSRAQPPASSLSRYIHRMGQCTFCNLTAWLKLIHRHLTGLRSIEVFLYLDKKMPVPQMGQSWVVDLLKLQKGPAGPHGEEGRLRTMQVKVYSNADEVGLAVQSDYKKAASNFMKGLKREIKNNAGAGRKDGARGMMMTRTRSGSAAGGGGIGGGGGSGSLLAPSNTEELGKDESGVVGPLRSVQTSLDDL